MVSIRQRNDPARLFLRRLGMIFLVLVVIFGISGVWNVYNKERESKILRNQAQMQLKDLQDQETHLSAQISKLQTDRGKEEAFREQYEMGKQGEGLIIIVEPEKPAPVQASSTLMRILHKFLPFW